MKTGLLFALSAFLAFGCGEPRRLPASDSSEQGRKIYGQVCVSCHGFNGVGIAGFGHRLRDNGWIQDHTDGELVQLIEEGRPGEHPENELGIDMPPRGGDPTLTPDDVLALAAYLRSLQ